MKFRTEAERIKYEEDYRPAYNALMEWYPFALDDHADEEWQPIAGYDEFYHVSNYGRIKSFYAKKPRIRKPALNIGGYLYIGLSLDGKTKWFRVNRLVAQAFIPNPDNKPEVNHRIGWKLNCYVGNLEWATSSDNQKHAFATGLHVAVKGTEHGRSKIKDEKIIIYIRENPDGLTTVELAEKCGLNERTISAIQTGERWGQVGGTIRKAKKQRVSDEQREEIRIKFATGQYSQRQLAKMHNVTQPTVCKIINE